MESYIRLWTVSLRFKPSSMAASEVAQTTLSKANHFLQTPTWRGGHLATPTACLPPTPPQDQHDSHTMLPTIFQHKTDYCRVELSSPEVVIETFISWIYSPPPPPPHLPSWSHSGDWLVECCFTSTETIGLLGTDPRADGTKGWGRSMDGTNGWGRSAMGGTKRWGRSMDGTTKGWGRCMGGTKGWGHCMGGTKGWGHCMGGTKGWGHCMGGTKGWGRCMGGTKGWGRCMGGTKGWGHCMGGTKGWGHCMGGTKGWGHCMGGTKGWGRSMGGTKGWGRCRSDLPALGNISLAGTWTLAQLACSVTTSAIWPVFISVAVS